MSHDYDHFKTIDVSWEQDGILVLRLHSRGGPLGWNALPHRELPELFAEVAADRDVRVVVLTGSGDRFIDLHPGYAVRNHNDHGAISRCFDHDNYERRSLVPDHVSA